MIYEWVLLWEIVERDCCLIIASLSPARGEDYRKLIFTNRRDGYPVAYLTLLRIRSTGLAGWDWRHSFHVIFKSVHTNHSLPLTLTLIYFSMSSLFSVSPPRVENEKSHDDFLKENFLSWNQFIFLFFTHQLITSPESYAACTY